ncbi:MAG: zinc finger-like domain-containing protein [Micavibrio sp.]|nr:zinc finger-like domain-containing protein [Micavibrio sp.]
MSDHDSPPNPEDQPPQATKSAAEGGYIYHADIDPEYKELVLKQILTALAGNGVKKSDVELSHFDGETLELITITTLKLKSKLTDRRQAGKVSGPAEMSSPQAITEAVEREIHKITHSQDVIKRIKDAIVGRKDQGFLIENEWIKFPFLTKSYVVYEPCPQCRAQGRMNCPNCQGKGNVSCPKCYGSGQETCSSCGGRQYTHNPQTNQNVPCMICSGSGKKMCAYCQQRTTVQCNKCRGAMVLTCSQCNGHAHISRVFIAEIDGLANFEYDLDNLPERVHTILKDLDKKAADHVIYTPILMQREQERDDNAIIIPYQVKAPLADFIFKIGEEKYGGFMFGTQAKLDNLPYFLENILSDGVKDLKEASNGEGDISAKIIKAGRYKTLRQIIMATIKLGEVKAVKAVLQRNPIGLSQETCKKYVAYADRAIHLITDKPRKVAAIAGLIFTAIIACIYFYTVRAMLMSALPPMLLIGLVIDIIVSLGVAYIALYGVKMTAGLVTRKTLAALVKSEPKSIKLGKAGQAGKVAFWVSMAIFAVIVGSTFLFGQNAFMPEWVAQIQFFMNR